MEEGEVSSPPQVSPVATCAEMEAYDWQGLFQDLEVEERESLGIQSKDKGKSLLSCEEDKCSDVEGFDDDNDNDDDDDYDDGVGQDDVVDEDALSSIDYARTVGEGTFEYEGHASMGISPFGYGVNESVSCKSRKVLTTHEVIEGYDPDRPRLCHVSSNNV